MNVARAVIMAMVAMPLLWLLFAGFGRDPHAVPFVLHNRPAPSFCLQNLEGGKVALAEPFSAAKSLPTLINFWATWCYPCQAEHDLLQQTAHTYAGRLRVLGIIYNDSKEAAASYIAANGSAYAQLLDPDSRTAIDYGVAGVPESFIIDGNGIIVHKQSGVLSSDTIERHLVPLLAP